ncbi:hypothetical protein F5Y16DRAFT_140984 [Xylariaceae sp. FL0255]|nr:hypothetical protein F5Y16DRAFT_140984 [Xylariaceae sp. FL0255]
MSSSSLTVGEKPSLNDEPSAVQPRKPILTLRAFLVPLLACLALLLGFTSATFFGARSWHVQRPPTLSRFLGATSPEVWHQYLQEAIPSFSKAAIITPSIAALAARQDSGNSSTPSTTPTSSTTSTTSSSTTTTSSTSTSTTSTPTSTTSTTSTPTSTTPSSTTTTTSTTTPSTSSSATPTPTSTPTSTSPVTSTSTIGSTSIPTTSTPPSSSPPASSSASFSVPPSTTSTSKSFLFSHQMLIWSCFIQPIIFNFSASLFVSRYR